MWQFNLQYVLKSVEEATEGGLIDTLRFMY